MKPTETEGLGVYGEQLDLGDRTLTFDRFYGQQFPRALSLAMWLTQGNRPVAEELVQEAFLAAHRRWGDVSSLEDPGAWVRRVLSNHSVSRFRRAQAEARAISRLRSRRLPAVELPESDGPLWAAIGSLPRRQAAAVALVYIADYTIAEAAEVMGCGTETIKTHLARARVSLRRALEGDSDGR